ncbi:MAG: plastocyanin/azurin family copper-binding protein [Acidovorax sp.]
MKAMNLIAASTLLACVTAVFSHENSPHHATKASAPREQKDWGIAGDVKDVRRTIVIRMTDKMRFTPSAITVHEGETVRLRAQNQGKVLHEIVIGTQTELAQHAEMMMKFPAMEHDEPYMAHVRAGGQGDVVWQFNRPGSFDFACLIPGHFQAGMTGTITVLPRKP